MSTIKIKTAFHYRTLKVVIIGGEVSGSLKTGDILYNVENYKESYIVKGTALMKLSQGVGSAIDIQLEEGDYSAQELIGKMLTTEISE